MTREELQAKLAAKGVDPSLYSLDGLASHSECYCVLGEGEKWKVVYKERGEVSEISEFKTQSEAYEMLCGEFRRMFRWQS